MWLGVRDVFSTSKCKHAADACPFQAYTIVPLNIAELWAAWRPRLASHPALARAASRQWLGTSFLNKFVLLFPFWKRPMSKESVQPMAEEEGKFKGDECLGAAKWNPTPHLHHEFCNELADLAVFMTQVTQLGKCQEHLFWEQEVHVMKTAELFSILCTLIVFQILIFRKTLFKAFRVTFLTANYSPCNIWMMKL